VVFSLEVSPPKLCRNFSPRHTCHTLCPTQPPLLYRPNTMNCGAHITKHLSVQFYQFPGSSSLLAPNIPLNSQLSSTPIFLPSCDGPSFTPTQSNEQSFSLACFNIYILRHQTACLKNMDRTVASLPEFDLFLMFPHFKKLTSCRLSFCSLTITAKPTSQRASKGLTVLSSAALCLRVRLGVFRAVFVMRVTPYSLVSGNQHFGDAFFLHVPEYTVSQSKTVLHKITYSST